MAYSEALANRVRRLMTRRKGAGELKMMGGLCFTLHGHMCCGVLKSDLVVRVGPDCYEKVLEDPHVRPMDFTGRPLKGFVFVGPAGHRTDARLADWIERAAVFVRSLPPKQPRRKPGGKAGI